MKTRHLLHTAALCLLTSALCPLAIAQAVPQPRLANDDATLAATGTAPTVPVVTTTGTLTTSGTTDDVIQMSVFDVNASKDKGYMGGSTAAGTRLNTDLKDTSASISAFTKEFLDDIGATSIDEMLNYAGDVEAEYDDSSAGFNDAGGRSAGGNSFRIRGLTGGIMTDFTDSGVPADLYNIDRAEISSGANSILFGMGAQGGMVTLTTKKANVNRNTLNVTNVIGTWSSPAVSGIPMWRATMDYNLVLMPHTMAFRLSGLYQDGGDSSWRGNVAFRSKRLNPVVTIKPFKNTTINLAYEAGRVRNSTASGNTTLTDSVSYWNYAGNPIMRGFGAAYAAPPAIMINALTGLPTSVAPTSQIGGTGSPNFVLVNNNASMSDYRGAYQTNGGSTFAPISSDAYYYNMFGPGAIRTQRLQRWAAIIQQSVGMFNFELAYNHNKNDAVAHAPVNNNESLYADPNSLVSGFDWLGAAGVNANPFAGRYYMENNWQVDYLTQINDDIRLTSEVTFNLKLFGKQIGRHRLLNLLEYASNDSYRDTQREVLLDDQQRGFTNVNFPAATGNQFVRRQYVTPGDYSTYYVGDWQTPVDDMNIGGTLYHTAYVSNVTSAKQANTNPRHIQRTTQSAMFVLQSYWLQGNDIVTTFGARFDNIHYQRAISAPITDPNDPRILSGQKALNEYDLTNAWANKRQFMARTYTAGGVWHATDRVSFFLNYSTNNGGMDSTYFDGRTVLQDGMASPGDTTGGFLPPVTKGRSQDYGVMYDILGNGKYFFRFTRYDTRQSGVASVVPNGATATALGSNQLYNIFDALAFLQSTSQNGTAAWAPGAGPTGNPANNGANWGPMPLSQYAVFAPSPGFPYGSPPSYTAGTITTAAQGYEFELTANPTPRLTLRLTFTYQNRNRADLFPEIFNYFNSHIPGWVAMANSTNPNSPDGVYYYGGAKATVNPITGEITPPPGGVTLHDYIYSQLFGTGNGGVRSTLNSELARQSMPFASRPFKSNLSIRYTFDKTSFFKGMALGSTLRYRSYSLQPSSTNAALRQSLSAPPSDFTDIALDPTLYVGKMGMNKSETWYFLDAFINYKCKVFSGRSNMRLQLNINNIFDQYVVSAARYNNNDPATGYISRVYLNTPRTFRFTASFDF